MFHQLENSLTINEPTKGYNSNNNNNNDSNNNNNYLTPGPFHDSSSTSRCAFQRLSQNPQWLTRKTQRQMAERKSLPNYAPFRPPLEWWLWNTEIDISLKECYSNRRAAHCKKSTRSHSMKYQNQNCQEFNAKQDVGRFAYDVGRCLCYGNSKESTKTIS